MPWDSNVGASGKVMSAARLLPNGSQISDGLNRNLSEAETTRTSTSPCSSCLTASAAVSPPKFPPSTSTFLRPITAPPDRRARRSAQTFRKYSWGYLTCRAKGPAPAGRTPRVTAFAGEIGRSHGARRCRGLRGTATGGSRYPRPREVGQERAGEHRGGQCAEGGHPEHPAEFAAGVCRRGGQSRPAGLGRAHDGGYLVATGCWGDGAGFAVLGARRPGIAAKAVQLARTSTVIASISSERVT